MAMRDKEPERIPRAKPVFSSTGPDNFKICPVCAEEVQKRAKFCRYCDEPLSIAGRIAREKEYSGARRHQRYTNASNNISKVLGSIGCGTIVIIALIIGALSGNGNNNIAPSNNRSVQKITIGWSTAEYPSSRERATTAINLWSSPDTNTRKWTGYRLYHGTRARLLGQQGNYILIESGAARGWISKDFILSYR